MNISYLYHLPGITDSALRTLDRAASLMAEAQALAGALELAAVQQWTPDEIALAKQHAALAEALARRFKRAA